MASQGRAESNSSGMPWGHQQLLTLNKNGSSQPKRFSTTWPSVSGCCSSQVSSITSLFASVLGPLGWVPILQDTSQMRNAR